MLRTVFAIAVAGLIFTAVSGTAQAAPIAPLPRVTRSTLESCWMCSGAAAGVTDGGVYIAVAAGATVGAVSVAGDLTLTALV